MRRRLLDLCLLAYPRARRERDRDYLRDLALDLADRHGFLRQALSLLRGGLGERIEVRRRGASRGTWIKRVVVACFVLAALALAANGLIRPPEGDGEQIQQIEQFACVYTDHPRSQRNRPPVIDAGECAQTRRLVAARERGGWDCTTHRRTRPGRRSTSWECARGSEAVAWLGL